MEMQIESLSSEVKYKTEQASRLQNEAFSKDADFDNLRKEIEALKQENENLKQSQSATKITLSDSAISQPASNILNKVQAPNVVQAPPPAPAFSEPFSFLDASIMSS